MFWTNVDFVLGEGLDLFFYVYENFIRIIGAAISYEKI